MGKAVKFLSILLIAASLFGLAASGLSLKEALDSKAYWEGASGGGDSIGMLEDGLNQLKENEQAYLDGREALAAGKEAYEEGVKKLEEGQAQYDEGAKTLEAKQAEYDAGVAKIEEAQVKLRNAEEQLAAGQAQYDAGAAALAQARTLQGGLGQIVSGFGTWQQGYQGLQAFQASAGLPAPAADNVATYNAAIDAAKAQVENGLGYCDTLDTLYAGKAQLEGAIAAMLAADPSADVSAYESQLATVNGNIAAIEAGLGGETRDTLTAKKAMLEQLTGVPQAVADGQQTIANGTSQAVNGALGNEDMAAALTSASGMSADQLRGTVGALGSMDYATFNSTMSTLVPLANSLSATLGTTISEGEAALAAAAEQLDAGYAAYRTGYAQYRYGKQQLEEGAVLLEEGRAKLEEAAKQLEDGKAQLADAEKQIADGEAQLAVFEDGRDQVIAGLETAIGTEAYEGTQSIADRLGAGFSYMKNDTDLDFDKGLEVVAAARAYAADTTDAVTAEITGKAIGAIIAIAGAAVALIGGLLGLLLKKPGFAGVIALLGGAAAAYGAYTSASVGSFFSKVAGAAGPTLLIAGAAATAIVALPQAISAFAAGGKKSAEAAAAASAE